HGRLSREGAGGADGRRPGRGGRARAERLARAKPPPGRSGGGHGRARRRLRAAAARQREFPGAAGGSPARTPPPPPWRSGPDPPPDDDQAYTRLINRLVNDIQSGQLTPVQARTELETAFAQLSPPARIVYYMTLFSNQLAPSDAPRALLVAELNDHAASRLS